MIFFYAILLIIFISNYVYYSDATIGKELTKKESAIKLDSIYENPNHNLNFSYPSKWKILSNIDNVTLISPLENASDHFQEKINLTTETKGNIKPTNKLSIKIIGYRQNLDGFTLLDYKKDFLSGKPAYEIIYTYKQGNNTFTKLEIFSDIGIKTYSFSFLTETNKYKIYIPVIKDILNSIKVRDLATGERKTDSRSAQLDISIDPYDMVASPVTGKLYITNIRFHTVSIVDSSTDKVLKVIKVGRFPTSIDIDTDLNNIFVANSRSNSISVIDGSTDEVIKELNTGLEPGTLIIDDVEKGLDSLVFVVNSRSDSISIIDGGKLELRKEAIKTDKNPTGIALNKITNTMYITNKDLNSVSVIDYFLSEDGLFHYHNITTIKVGKYPTGIDVNPNTNKIYVANSYSNSISVIDGSSNTVEKIIPAGIEPADVEVNPDTDNIYVTNYQNNTVSIINGNNDSIIKNLYVGKYPDSLYLNPINDIIYVVNVGSNSISQIRDTSLLAGITYKIHPTNSGQLDCDGKKILENDYIRYKVGSEIDCTASPNSEYEFKSWSGDITPKSDSLPQTKFISTRYGNITANFHTPVELNLPEGYWDQVRLAVASVVIPAVIGWLIPSIASFINATKQRRSMRKTMQKILAIHESKIYDDETHNKRLLDVQDEIIKKLTLGKISESQYDILNNKISSLQKK